MKLRGLDIYIVLLLEFKSQPERFALVQMALSFGFYRRLVASEKKLHALPPVFPILLYSGKRRWTMPLHLDALVESMELLGKYKIDFECFPIRSNSFSRRTLLAIGNIVSTLFLAEAHYDLKLMEQEFRKLSERMSGEPLAKIPQYTGLSENMILKLGQTRNGKKAES